MKEISLSGKVSQSSSSSTARCHGSKNASHERKLFDFCSSSQEQIGLVRSNFTRDRALRSEGNEVSVGASIPGLVDGRDKFFSDKAGEARVGDFYFEPVSPVFQNA